jgi:uncharacterized protein
MGQTALITGASSGIGRELAAVFARNHCDLVLVARREELLGQLAKELSGRYGVQARAEAVDLSDPDSAAQLAERLKQDKISVDFLINNAGFAMSGLFAQSSLKTLRRMLELNMVTLTLLTRLLLPSMRDRRQGRILNVASTAALVPGPLMSAYYASKAYVLSFSEALAVELEGTGVTVTALCPGATDTEFQDRAKMHKARLLRLGKTSPRQVAEIGFKELMRGRRVVFTSFRDLMLPVLLKISPRFLQVRSVKWLNDFS